jgi:hypothetical protein
MKRASIIPAISAILQTAFPSVAVVMNDFSNAAKAAQEVAIRDAGAAIVVQPILSTRRVGQAGPRPAELAVIAVVCRIDPAIPGAPEPYATHDAIISAVLADRALRADLADDATELIAEDSGMVTHALHFTVKIIP